MPAWIMLIAQAVLLLLAFRLMWRVVLPGVGRSRELDLVLDVWGPVAVIAPMLFLAVRTGGSAVGVGWIAVGAPVACGLLALGAVLLVGGAAGGADLQPPWRCFAASTAVGLLLLLLASAHDLSVWAGQCAFAAGAVLIWMNTPEPVTDGEADQAGVSRVGGATLLALLLAGAAGAAALLAGPESAPLAGAMMVAYAAMVVVAAARLTGPVAALRLGCWAATYGVLLGLGIISLTSLLPEAFRIIREGDAEPIHRVAHGFGVYAFEAMALVLLALAVLAGWRLRPGARSAVGAGVIIVAAVLAAWRLAAM